MKPSPTPNQIRARIAAAAAERGVSMAQLSRVLARSDGYMQRYVREGLPDRLGEDDRATLARFMGADAAEFGVVASEKVPGRARR